MFRVPQTREQPQFVNNGQDRVKKNGSAKRQCDTNWCVIATLATCKRPERNEQYDVSHGGPPSLPILGDCLIYFAATFIFPTMPA